MAWRLVNKLSKMAAPSNTNLNCVVYCSMVWCRMKHKHYSKVTKTPLRNSITMYSFVFSNIAIIVRCLVNKLSKMAAFQDGYTHTLLTKKKWQKLDQHDLLILTPRAYYFLPLNIFTNVMALFLMIFSVIFPFFNVCISCFGIPVPECVLTVSGLYVGATTSTENQNQIIEFLNPKRP